MNKLSAKDRPSTNSGAQRPADEDKEKQRKPGVVPPATKPGNTTASQAEEKVPRLPHERDESADSQKRNPADSPSAEHTRQAFEDLERGLVNTDRGLEGDTHNK